MSGGHHAIGTQGSSLYLHLLHADLGQQKEKGHWDTWYKREKITYSSDKKVIHKRKESLAMVGFHNSTARHPPQKSAMAVRPPTTPTGACLVRSQSTIFQNPHLWPTPRRSKNSSCLMFRVLNLNFAGLVFWDHFQYALKITALLWTESRSKCGSRGWGGSRTMWFMGMFELRIKTCVAGSTFQRVSVTSTCWQLMLRQSGSELPEVLHDVEVTIAK